MHDSMLFRTGLPGRPLLLRFFVRAMVANGTPCRSTNNTMMTSEMAGRGANRCTFYASLRIG